MCPKERERGEGQHEAQVGLARQRRVEVAHARRGAGRVARVAREHEDAHGDKGREHGEGAGKQREEGEVVVLADAVVQPHAVVVEGIDALEKGPGAAPRAIRGQG